LKTNPALVLTKADQVLAEIEEATKHSFLPIVGPVKGKILTRTIKDVKPRRVLESLKSASLPIFSMRSGDLKVLIHEKPTLFWRAMTTLAPKTSTGVIWILSA